MNLVGLSAFIRYACVGVANTSIHTCAFLWLVYYSGLGQGTANLIAFLLAVTFSYFVNARWTFRSPMSVKRYGIFAAFMAALALLIGQLAQRLGLPPVLTLCLFSGLSLSLGYVFSRNTVFRAAR